MKGWMKIGLLVLIIFVSVGTFYYLAFSSFIKGAPPISRNSYLELNIFGNMPERSSVNPFAKIFAGDIPSLEGVLNCIRKAKIDPKIKGIIIRPLASDIGWAKLDELRAAISDFKESEKPVYVYLEAGGNREYYLALSGDVIFGPPDGTLFLNGLLAGAYFFRGTLDKIGLEADFVAHGKYKNAPDIFTRKSMSEAQREVVNAILDDYFERYINAIAAARNLEKSEVMACVNQGLFGMKNAREKHLLDTLMYYNEFKDYLKEKDGKRVRTVSYSRYRKVPYSKLGVKPKESIALIYATGDIVSGIGENLQDGLITSENMANTIRKAAKNKQMKAIVLRVESPGGSGTASDVIWREVVEARKKKPVIVSMSDVAASGGYYISMAADSIVAEPNSIVGSIGVFGGKFSFKRLYDKLGIHKEEIARGENADLFSEIKTFSPKQRRLMKQFGDDFYHDFVSKVAEGRHMSYEDVDKIAQGRVYTGRQALEIGLVDKLGGVKEAIQMAKKMAGIPVNEYVRVRTYPSKRSFLERILAGGLDAKWKAELTTLPKPLQNYLLGFRYWKNHQPLALLPFYLDIR